MYLVTCGSLRGAAAAVLCLIQHDNSFSDRLHQQVVDFVVVVVVLTLLTRIIKCVVTEQTPVTLWIGAIRQENTNKPKVVHAYIIADAIHASARKI